MLRRQGLTLAVAGLAAAAGWTVATRESMPSGDKPSATDAKIDASIAALWPLQLEGLNGLGINLKDFQGKPLVLNFWATWCPPCLEELPLLNRFYTEHAAKSWQVLGIAIDKGDAVRRFVEKMPLSFPIALAGAHGIGLSREMGNATGGLPFTVVVNASGQVVHRKMGILGPTELNIFLL